MQAKTIGIVLIMAGLAMIAYTGFHYVTTEKVIDIGPIEINKEKSHFVQWPPVVGILLLVGGIVVMARSRKAL